MKKITKRLLLICSLCGLCEIGEKGYKIYAKERKAKEKNRMLMQLFVKWMENRERGKSIANYLKELGIRKIAIYGMSDAGKRLYDELKKSDIDVEYAIDRRYIEFDEQLEIVTLQDSLKEVDAIIVTAISEYGDILENLRTKVSCEIISLEQVVYELNAM